MSDEYVVLRIDEPASAVLGGGGAAASARSSALARAEVSMETLTLGASEVAEVRREPRVLHAARAMPVTLIQPLAAEEEATADEGDATWGLEAVGALASNRDGSGVRVAILDTGINADHQAFAGLDVVQKDFTGEGDGDGNGHGTHCAGTVCGGSVGGKRIGVAHGVEKVLIGKVLGANGGGSTEQIVNGLTWAAEEGANVISMSLGLDFPGLVARLVDRGFPTEQATSFALEAYRDNVRLFDALAELVRARSSLFSQCIVVAASGNESQRPRFTIAAAPPSAADGFLAVGALGRTNGPTSDLEVASFSNSGPALTGPGVGILSAAHNSNNGLRSLSGTSMATPHVAGVAALWIQELRDDNPDFQIGELEANLIGRAAKNVFVAGVEPGDRGSGLVQAP